MDELDFDERERWIVGESGGELPFRPGESRT